MSDEVKNIDANQAVQIALGVGLFMLRGDKENRELLYSNLTNKDLQRVLRWQTRFLLQHMASMAADNGIDLEEAYGAWQLAMTTKAANGEFY